MPCTLPADPLELEAGRRTRGVRGSWKRPSRLVVTVVTEEVPTMDAAAPPRAPQVRAIYRASLAPGCHRRRPPRRRRRLSPCGVSTLPARLAGQPHGGTSICRSWGPVTRCCIRPTAISWPGRGRTRMVAHALQLWVVTTDPGRPRGPADRFRRRAFRGPQQRRAVIAWDGGTHRAAILTGDDGVGISCLIDPATGEQTDAGPPVGGRLVDAWAGSALIRVGPRGYRDLLMLHGGTGNRAAPFTIRLHHRLRGDPRRPRATAAAARGRRARPPGWANPSYMHGPSSSEGFVRALIRSDNGTDHARLLG